jgi:beta-1,4-N-acetylglucosaminyltransferase
MSRIESEKPVHIEKVDILLYACVGGHLDQLVGIAESLVQYKLCFVVNDRYADRSIMSGRTLRVTFAERDWRQFINIYESIKILFRTRPKVIISTGSAPAVWFFYFGKLFGSKLIFVESIARVKTLSLTGKLVKPVADHFYVQWCQLARHTKAKYAGMVNGGKV